jgi:hypothetical protein
VSGEAAAALLAQRAAEKLDHADAAGGCAIGDLMRPECYETRQIAGAVVTILRRARSVHARYGRASQVGG